MGIHIVSLLERVVRLFLWVRAVGDAIYKIEEHLREIREDLEGKRLTGDAGDEESPS